MFGYTKTKYPATFIPLSLLKSDRKNQRYKSINQHLSTPS